MKNIVQIVGVIALLVAFSGSAWAQERGTRAEAQVLVESAVEHIQKVGIDKASEDFTKDKSRWSRKDLYVFSSDMTGVARGHGVNEKLVGKNLLALKDQTGKEYVREFVKVAQSAKGEGWVDYEWSSPTTKQVEGKTSFIKRVPGTDFWVGVGVYR